MPRDPSDKALLDFIAEAEELLESLEQDILLLDETAQEGELSREVLNRIFRSAHTLKGVSGMYGFDRMSRLGHVMEEIFDALRMDRIVYSGDLKTPLLGALQVFKEVIKRRSDEDKDLEPRFADWHDRLSAAVHSPPPAEVAPAPGASPPKSAADDIQIDPEILKVLTEYEEHVLKKHIKANRAIYKVHCAFPIDAFDKGLEKVTEQLKSVADVISVLPSTSTGDENKLEFDILVATDRLQHTLLSAIDPQFRLEDFILPRKSEPAAVAKPRAAAPVLPPAPAPAPAPHPAALEERGETKVESVSLKSVAETVRVDIHRLDQLMNIVGELILYKTMLNQASTEISVRWEALAKEIAERFNLGPSSHEVLARSMAKALPPTFVKANKELDRRLKELQNRMMEVRLVPLKQVFSRLMREIRKLRDQLNKQIDVRMEGEETELDKLLVEELVDPLMHLVRNAVDHGIPSRGTVSLKASQIGNHVVVEVADDGSGIDPAKVLKVALERKMPRGLELKAELDRLAAAETAKGQAQESVWRNLLQDKKSEIFSFLFEPGFSTKTEVSTLSGRGVGLDVVKRNISRHSGIIEVKSEVGQGSTFTITLPITLAIIQVLLVQVENHQFAISLSSVLETRELPTADIRTIERKEVMQLRERTLPLVRVRSFLGLNGTVPEKQFVVVVGYGEKVMGLIVDELHGQQDVVIKSLGRLLRGIRGFAGAADLGSKTILVLDVGHIISTSYRM
ncbi:MAG: chemotaxis protein CheA [Nitrospirae bacterium]|nr:chemotaxis protein CheA [Nitrospirota bacterium]